MHKKIFRQLSLVLLAACFVPTAFAECPQGTWPRNLYSGPGGGLSTEPGGGMYEGPGGGMSTEPGGGLYEGPGGGMSREPGGGLFTGPGGGLYQGQGGGLYEGPGGGMYRGPGGGLSKGPKPYCSNRPPWPILIKYLEEYGFEDEVRLIRSQLNE